MKYNSLCLVSTLCTLTINGAFKESMDDKKSLLLEARINKLRAKLKSGEILRDLELCDEEWEKRKYWLERNLLHATRNGDFDDICYYLEEGAGIDKIVHPLIPKATTPPSTPLLEAISNLDSETVALLLFLGAMPPSTDLKITISCGDDLEEYTKIEKFLKHPENIVLLALDSPSRKRIQRRNTCSIQ